MASVAAFREKVPTEQKDDPDKSHNDKVQSTSFHTGKDSGDTDGIATVSAAASNTDGDEMPNMFMAATQPKRIAGDQDGFQLQFPDSESAAAVVNFARENQVDKTSGVNRLPKESKLLGQIVSNRSVEARSWKKRRQL